LDGNDDEKLVQYLGPYATALSYMIRDEQNDEKEEFDELWRGMNLPKPTLDKIKNS
jgi:hypothetical protein